MSWARPPVAAALVDMIGAATAGTVFVHDRPPMTLNPMAVVIMRPNTVTYATAAFGIDEVELPVAVVGGLDTEDAIDQLKSTVRQTVEGDTTLKGTVLTAWPAEERNWREITGAGGIQLLYVELILQIHM
jgi:hypothetical protein